jgi:hypothetical protein
MKINQCKWLVDVIFTDFYGFQLLHNRNCTIYYVTNAFFLFVTCNVTPFIELKINYSINLAY